MIRRRRDHRKRPTDPVPVPAAGFDDSLEEGLARAGESALEAEMGAAIYLFIVSDLGAEPLAAFERWFIPDVEARSSVAALGLLLGLDSITRGRHDQVARLASAAAGRLVAAGVQPPRWANELVVSIEVGDCIRVYDDGTEAVWAAGFGRAGSWHTFMVSTESDVATDVFVVDPEQLPATLDMLWANRRARGVRRTETLVPAEWRWRVERALDADVRGTEVLEQTTANASYPLLRLLLRARLAAMPPAPRR